MMCKSDLISKLESKHQAGYVNKAEFLPHNINILNSIKMILNV